MGTGVHVVDETKITNGESLRTVGEYEAMTEYEGLSNEEVYEVLLHKLSKGEKVSVQNLQDIVATRSVVDPKASEDAVTIFYSGESEELINKLSAIANDKVRVIRRTEAFEFLADNFFKPILTEAIKQDYIKLKGQELENEVLRLLYESSKTEDGILKEGEGFWTVISRRFAAETKGDAYSLCTNAAEDRIFSRDELRTWLANAPKDAQMAGITKENLSAMSQGKEQFEAVKAKTIEDMKGTTLYFNEEGIKVGQTFQGTSLAEYVEDIIPEESAYTVTMAKYVQFLRDDEMKAKLGESYEALSGLEKLQAREKEYLARIIDLLKPVEKLNLYRDADGEMHIGEREKLVITKGMDGGLKIGTSAIKDIPPSIEKAGIREFVK